MSITRLSDRNSVENKQEGPRILNNSPQKPLGVFSLVMINVMAITSLRSLPIAAQYGWASPFFYLVAAVLFFIPTALVSAELVTAWPNRGGAYAWIRTAFGRHWGFFAIWLQWIYNVVWYPSILTFMATTIFYGAGRHFFDNKAIILGSVLTIWWLVIGLNGLGLRVSNWISGLGVLVGTLIPMLIMILLGFLWVINGHPTTSPAPLCPQLASLHNLGFLTSIVFSLMGLEMSAIYAKEVAKPQRDYPRALLWSSLLILASLVLGSLAIAVVVPPQQLGLLSGLVEAYVVFFTAYHLEKWIPVVIGLIVIGSFGGVSTWTIGPTRALLIAAHESYAMKDHGLLKLNCYGAPLYLLLLQGFLVTLLCSVFILLPTVQAAYWLLNVMASQLAIIYYLCLFLAALRLRYQYPACPQAYRIPGGHFGICLVIGLGVLTCLFVFIVGFWPASHVISSTHLWSFELALIAGVTGLALLPLFILRNHRQEPVSPKA